MQEFTYNELFDFMVNEVEAESIKRLKSLPTRKDKIVLLEAALSVVPTIQQELFDKYMTTSAFLMEQMNWSSEAIEELPNTLETHEHKEALMNLAFVAREHQEKAAMDYKNNKERLEAKTAFAVQRLKRYQTRERDAARVLAAKPLESSNDWYVDGATLVYGGTLKRLACALNELEPHITARYNTTKPTPRSLVERLTNEGLIRLQYAQNVSLEKDWQGLKRDLKDDENINTKYYDSQLIEVLRHLLGI